LGDLDARLGKQTSPLDNVFWLVAVTTLISDYAPLAIFEQEISRLETPGLERGGLDNFQRMELVIKDFYSYLSWQGCVFKDVHTASARSDVRIFKFGGPYPTMHSPAWGR